MLIRLSSERRKYNNWQSCNLSTVRKQNSVKRLLVNVPLLLKSAFLVAVFVAFLRWQPWKYLGISLFRVLRKPSRVKARRNGSSAHSTKLSKSIRPSGVVTTQPRARRMAFNTGSALLTCALRTNRILWPKWKDSVKTNKPVSWQPHLPSLTRPTVDRSINISVSTMSVYLASQEWRQLFKDPE